MTMMPRQQQQRRLWLQLVTACLLFHTASGFASWLKCYVDLDETEVVMNYPIQLQDEAPHLVEIELRLVADDSESDEWTVTDLTYSADTDTKVHARLRIPEELQGKDLQYVIETSKGALFVPDVMCQGTRTHARSSSEIVELVVSGEQESVELLAGWATGHEAVSLTPKTVLRRVDESEL